MAVFAVSRTSFFLMPRYRQNPSSSYWARPSRIDPMAHCGDSDPALSGHCNVLMSASALKRWIQPSKNILMWLYHKNSQVSIFDSTSIHPV
ncbi:hypothetical protein LMH87_007386 [Akanthomyces muscarius]|uniref:Uncharacterized protein n=1 Tax=Akanthomyces muscarius TaxID=2231603 RepID=A0A9W8QSZ8_AKAMU|nr:hypothetical protein LMH87_007386 [Akanthomyces muscarius]KAJ4165767.1 hypothetical protein LMH87_007386 [Akanthomyces muscarius]